MIEELMQYVPFNEEEKLFKQEMIEFIKNNPLYLFRENEEGHLTVSCWIVNKSRDKVLMCYHNIFNSYSWCGGHSDGEKDIRKTCLKEAHEETGLYNLAFIDEKIFSIEILDVKEHIKNGKIVNKHKHYNLTFILEADDNEKLRIKEDENSSLRWMKESEVYSLVKETWLIDHVYKKLFLKMKMINEYRN